MNERRTAILEKVYHILDRDGSGKLTAADIEKIYTVDKHKDFVSGKKTKQELLMEFLNNFEGAAGNKDGFITKEEFMDYYNDLSMVIPNDDYFVGLIESVWMVCEKEDSVTDKEQVNALVTKLMKKFKELVPVLDANMMEKLFKEFNKSHSGSITIDEMASMISKLGILAERKHLTEVFKKFDANKSGTIELDEFAAFIKSSS